MEFRNKRSIIQHILGSKVDLTAMTPVSQKKTIQTFKNPGKP